MAMQRELEDRNGEREGRREGETQRKTERRQKGMKGEGEGGKEKKEGRDRWIRT